MARGAVHEVRVGQEILVQRMKQSSTSRLAWLVCSSSGRSKGRAAAGRGDALAKASGTDQVAEDALANVDSKRPIADGFAVTKARNVSSIIGQPSPEASHQALAALHDFADDRGRQWTWRISVTLGSLKRQVATQIRRERQGTDNHQQVGPACRSVPQLQMGRNSLQEHPGNTGSDSSSGR